MKVTTKNATINQITPYLPYKLEAKMLSFKTDHVGKEFDTITGISQWSECGELWSLQTEGGSSPSISEIMPVLRSLSEFKEDDVEKVSEHVGAGKWCDAYDFYFEVWFSGEHDLKTLISQCHYEIFEYFLSNHYDVFDLIRKGFAIDKKNY